MNVSLTPELESLVNEKVQTGMYQTASEVVREALRLLKERDETKLRELREAYTEYDPANVRALAVAVRDRGRRRLTRQRGGERRPR